MPAFLALAGETIVIVFDGPTLISHCFENTNFWEVGSGCGYRSRLERKIPHYKAFEVRPADSLLNLKR